MRLAFWACLLAVAVTYVSTLVRNHAEAEDSLHYAVVADRADLGTELLTHGNHLLFAPIGHLAVALQRQIAPDRSAETALQLLNVVFALACIPLLWSLVPASIGARLATVCLFAFSYGVWRYAVESDVYMAPLLLMLVTWREVAVALREPARSFVGFRVGLACGVAILCHEQQLLTMLIAIFALGRARRRAAATAAGTATILVVVGYGIAALGLPDGFDALDWAARSGASAYGHVSPRALLRGAMGFAHSWIGGHFVFAFPGVSDTVASSLNDAMLQEETALAKAFSPRTAAALFVVLAAGVAAAAAFVGRWAVRYRSQTTMDEAVRRVVLPSVIVYAAFATWWDPDNVEFWLPVIPAVAVWVGFMLRAAAQDLVARGCVTFSVAALLVVNLFGSLLPQRSVRYDYWGAANGVIIRHAQRGDLVVSGAGWVSQGYIELYSGADVFSTLRDDEALRTDFLANVAAHGSGRVYVSSSVDTPPDALLRWLHLDLDATRRFFDRLEPGLTLVEKGKPYDLYEWQDVGVD